MKKIALVLSAVVLMSGAILAQEKPKDKGTFAEPKNAFFDEILKSTQEPGRVQDGLAQPSDVAGQHQYLLVLLDDLPF